MEMKKEGQLQIELKEEVAEGIYSNLAVIAHSSSEFVIDFVRLVPGVAKAQVKSRIIMTPEHAKRLAFALQDTCASMNRSSAKYVCPNSVRTLCLRHPSKARRSAGTHTTRLKETV